MARIVDHLPVEALEARYRAARDVAEARHYQAIWLLAQGPTFLEVGAVLAFAPRWVEELAQRYNASGPEALGDQRRRNGRAAGLLREDVLAALAERLRTPPDGGGLWSSAKVAAWMAQYLGLTKVHPQRGWEALKRSDWSIQAPRPRHGPEDLAAPDGVALVFLPAYSPELQPAEHLWPLVEEPIANRHVASLDELSTIVAARCQQLNADTLQPHTNFHWWPSSVQPS